jgi:hypothetical protein
MSIEAPSRPRSEIDGVLQRRRLTKISCGLDRLLGTNGHGERIRYRCILANVGRLALLSQDLFDHSGELSSAAQTSQGRRRSRRAPMLAKSLPTPEEGLAKLALGFSLPTIQPPSPVLALLPVGGRSIFNRHQLAECRSQSVSACCAERTGSSRAIRADRLEHCYHGVDIAIVVPRKTRHEDEARYEVADGHAEEGRGQCVR